jgi:hypothetical protein
VRLPVLQREEKCKDDWSDEAVLVLENAKKLLMVGPTSRPWHRVKTPAKVA